MLFLKYLKCIKKRSDTFNIIHTLIVLHRMSYMSPASFCTMCTNSCKQELVGFLLTLSIHHPYTIVFIVSDSLTKQYIEQLTPSPRLDIRWNITLDKYTHKNRQIMEKEGSWADFQMAKAQVIRVALEDMSDTMFLDSDTIICNKLYIKDPTKQLGVSPQFITDEYVKRTGYYNGGLLWTNQTSLPDRWIHHTKTSRYYDQASIEDLTKEYTYFEFGEEYNLQTWRFLLGVEHGNVVASHINNRDGVLYYNDRPLRFIHTHFNSPRFSQINNLFMSKMFEARMYREILCVTRLINEKWILTIPTQPAPGKWNHKDDSFRELALMISKSIPDIELRRSDKTGHCWLEPGILLYDRPTLQWLNQELNKAIVFFLGNGSMENEGEQLKRLGLHNVRSWIFWPRKPEILEKFINDTPLRTYGERSSNVVFIGNFENQVQERYRKNTHIDWKSVIDDYHCTKGTSHKFTQLEYLERLGNSKYGLCLRGYGSKCHREVELMALGTVPLVTPDVSIQSYSDPPVEGVHYFRVNTHEDITRIVEETTDEQWTKMSIACSKWYMRNVHSKHMMNTFLQSILYT